MCKLSRVGSSLVLPAASYTLIRDEYSFGGSFSVEPFHGWRQGSV